MSIDSYVQEDGRRLWCMGGKWFPAARHGNPNAAAAQEARSYGATHVVIDSDHRQIGLYELTEGPRPSWRQACYSAALALRDALDSDAHHAFAAFELGDGRFYLVAIVNRRLLIDGDQVVATDEGARAVYEAWRHAREWTNAVRIAPKSWNISDAYEAAIGPYLAAAQPARSIALTRPSSLVWWHYALAVATLVAGYQLVEPLLFPPPPAKPVPAPTAAAAVWEALPGGIIPAFDVLAWCERAVLGLQGQAPLGWPASKATCTATGATVQYSRSPDSPYRYVLAHPDLTVGTDSAGAERSVPAPHRDPRPLSAEGLPATQHVTAHLRDMAGTLRANLTVTERPPQLTGDKAHAPPAPHWVRMEWSLQTNAPASYWVGPLAAIPATTIATITYTLPTAQGPTTTIEGVTYATR